MNLETTDPELAKIIKSETERQFETLMLIPSENYTSIAVREAVGSVVMNKYSEGYPKKRYYQGNKYIDELEELTKTRALALFKLNPEEWHVNVQAFNGSAANLAVLSGLCEIGDTIMGMALSSGGHLSHGWQVSEAQKVSLTSRIFKPVYYEVDPKTQILDYENIESIALVHKPKIIISGGTGYPRNIDYMKMGQIAKKVKASYLADVAHEAGLIAGGVLPSPFEFADVVTMTTRKTLRGPIGALIFSRVELSDKIDRAVFPGLQGGPPNHQIAGVAVCLKEAMRDEYLVYSKQVIKNASILAEELSNRDFRLISGGTDKHLMVIDLTNKNVDGWLGAIGLETAGIIVNKSTIPFETKSPFYPSGIRLGTPAITTRGLTSEHMSQIADWIDKACRISVKYMSLEFESEDKAVRLKARSEARRKIEGDKDLVEISEEVKSFLKDFPTP